MYLMIILSRELEHPEVSKSFTFSRLFATGVSLLCKPNVLLDLLGVQKFRMTSVTCWCPLFSDCARFERNSAFEQTHREKWCKQHVSQSTTQKRGQTLLIVTVWLAGLKSINPAYYTFTLAQYEKQDRASQRDLTAWFEYFSTSVVITLGLVCP